MEREGYKTKGDDIGRDWVPASHLPTKHSIMILILVFRHRHNLMCIYYFRQFNQLVLSHANFLNIL